MRRRKRSKRSAREIAHDLLSRREHTAEELYGKLLLREISESEARAVVDGLTKIGLVDDRRACEVFLRSELRKRPQGRSRLRLNLAKRRVSVEIVQEYLEQFDDAWEKEEAIRAAGIWLDRRRNPEGLKQALVRHLRSRGFGWSSIRTAVESVLDETSRSNKESDIDD